MTAKKNYKLRGCLLYILEVLCIDYRRGCILTDFKILDQPKITFSRANLPILEYSLLIIECDILYRFRGKGAQYVPMHVSNECWSACNGSEQE